MTICKGCGGPVCEFCGGCINEGECCCRSDSQATKGKYKMDWKSNFSERELKEIEYCCLYKQQFGHGTIGHNMRIIIATMVSILDNAQSLINNEPEDISFNPH